MVHGDPTVAEAVRAACVTGSFCVYSYTSGEDFLKDDIPEGPGCLILDIILPGMNGFDLLDLLMSRGVKVPTIILTADGTLAMCARAFKRGVVDFFEVPFDSQSLLEAIDAAIKLDVVSRKVAARHERNLASVKLLTDRQRQVLSSIAAGHSMKETANALGVSQQTIARHRSQILRTFGVANEVELVRNLAAAGYFNDR